MNQLEKAIIMATEAHKGQKLKNGLPYILHPLHIMDKVETIDEKIVAVLHDIVEDTDVALEDLRNAGFNFVIESAVGVLTKREGETYQVYLNRVSLNEMATKVKIQDLLHNLDVTRLEKLTYRDVENVKKYHAGIKFLNRHLFKHELE